MIGSKGRHWQVVRMYDVDGKLLNGIKSMYVNSLTCVRVKGGESECLRINSGVRQWCIMSLWLFNVYMGAVMEEVKMGMGRWEESKDCLASCMQMTWFCMAMVGHFVEVCRRRGLKVIAGKSKGMVLVGEEGLECEVCLGVIHLEHVSEFIYLGCVLDKSGTDEAECSKVASGRRVASAIRSMVNARSLQLESWMSHCWYLFLCMVVRQ